MQICVLLNSRDFSNHAPVWVKTHLCDFLSQREKAKNTNFTTLFQQDVIFFPEFGKNIPKLQGGISVSSSTNHVLVTKSNFSPELCRGGWEGGEERTAKQLVTEFICEERQANE